jgi:hypothetical protein
VWIFISRASLGVEEPICRAFLLQGNKRKHHTHPLTPHTYTPPTHTHTHRCGSSYCKHRLELQSQHAERLLCRLILKENLRIHTPHLHTVPHTHTRRCGSSYREQRLECKSQRAERFKTTHTKTPLTPHTSTPPHPGVDLHIASIAWSARANVQSICKTNQQKCSSHPPKPQTLNPKNPKP